MEAETDTLMRITASRVPADRVPANRITAGRVLIEFAMETLNHHPDAFLLDFFRKSDWLSVVEIQKELGVTATAVRQRLQRLMGEGLIERQAESSGRGRPSYTYRLTEKGRRLGGTNYADLALVLWDEIRSVSDPVVRRGLLRRLVVRLAEKYRGEIDGNGVTERLESIVDLLGQRGIPSEAGESGTLPVLTALACPYPELAEQDRGICALEKDALLRTPGRVRTTL